MKLQKLYSYTRKAIDKYHLIEEGDSVAAAVSGGKDSLTLLYALSGLKSFYPEKFSLCAIIIDNGYGMDYSSIVEFCRSKDITCHIIETKIGYISEVKSSGKCRCSICANLRRGALVDAALKLGCNKIALGHHRDDIINTMFLSLLNEGQFYSFSPYTYYENADIAIIRPLIYVKEGEIENFAKQYKLPIVNNLCPEDKNSQRSEMNNLINQIIRLYPDSKDRIFHAIEYSNINDWVEARERK